MRANNGIIFFPSVVTLLAACGGTGGGSVDWATTDGSSAFGGSSGGSSGSGSLPASDSGAATSSSSSGGGSSSSSSGSGSSVPDASSSGRDSSTAGGPGTDAGSGADSGASSGPNGDGGLLPYKGVANSACADLVTLGVSWWYNWTQSPSSCTSRPFVPMIWGHTGNEQSAAGIASAVSTLVKAGYQEVLGFNEPDNTSQSNISVTTAISLWPSFNDPSVRIGSPATQGNSAGLTWIQNFMTQVNADTTGNLRVDFIASHWYGWNAGSCDANATNLEGWLKSIEAIAGNRPIWLTEWGCLNQSNTSTAVVQAFYSGAIAMFAKHPRLERYAWYPWTTNNELITNGALTNLGTVFAAAPASR
jgi:hypothetical protein